METNTETIRVDDETEIEMRHTHTALGPAWVARRIEIRRGGNNAEFRYDGGVLGRRCGEADLETCKLKALDAFYSDMHKNAKIISGEARRGFSDEKAARKAAEAAVRLDPDAAFASAIEAIHHGNNSLMDGWDDQNERYEISAENLAYVQRLLTCIGETCFISPTI